MRTLCGIALAGLAALLHPWPAAAQFEDGLSQAAVGVQAYEKSAGRCHYEPVVGRALERLREHYAGAEPYRWRRALREGADTDAMVGHLLDFALQGSPYTLDPNARAAPRPAEPADRGCAASGLSVGAALPFAAALIGFDPVLFGEADRLMKGGGRTRSGTPLPGSRSDAVPGSPAAAGAPPTGVAPPPPGGEASASSPEAVVREFVGYGVSGREKQLTGSYSGGASPALRKLFSAGFVRDWDGAWATGEDVFDASIVSGLQSVETTAVQGVWREADTGALALVTAALVVRADGAVIRRDQSFLLVREGGAWRIDEIVYGRLIGPHGVARIES